MYMFIILHHFTYSEPETVKNKNEQVLSSRMECELMKRRTVQPNRHPITLKVRVLVNLCLAA